LGVLVGNVIEANYHVFTVTGTLKGYDQLMNLVLDNVEEVTRGMFLSTVPS
jgi:hypothetical protein